MSIFDATLPVIVMKHPLTRRKVTFLSMIHIGTEEFYNSCNEILSKHKGVILFEGVGRLTEQERENLTDSQRLINQSMESFIDLYEVFAKILGWTTQSKHVPLKRDVWVHADISHVELLKAWERECLPIFPNKGNIPADAFEFKDAKVLEMVQSIFKGFIWLMARSSGAFPSPFSRGFERVILHRRNDAALSAFDSLPSDADALFIYGAKHGKGIIDGLKKRGYREHSRQNQHLFTVSGKVASTAIALIPLMKTMVAISKYRGWNMSRRIRQEGYVAVFGMPEE